jgi:N-acetylglucosamine kinase-like BadF-type ATPase
MNHRDSFFLGIDGGGTKTTAVIVDHDGLEVARAEGPTSNPSVIGFDAAGTVLTDLIGEVTTLGRASSSIASGWAGLSGFGRASDHEKLRPILEPIVPDLKLTNDVELVLGALPQTVGIALIAGTGSIVAGRNAKGEFVRVGGWGHLFGDEGSGFDFGRRALRAIAEQIDGRGPETTLTELIFQEWGITEPYQIITRAYDQQTDKAAIARLARFPLEQFYRKDPVSVQIVESAANDLASLVAAAARRLKFEASIPLALTGGIMIHHLVMRDLVLRKLREEWEIIDPVIVIDPALSAARSLAGFWGVPT